MERIQDVILAVLESMNKRTPRTSLVKLIYIIDEIYYRHFGETLSGLQYMWDNFGPNAVSNAIKLEADKLAKEGYLFISPQPNRYCDTTYYYSIARKKDLSLTPAQRYVINDQIRRLKDKTWNELVAISKQTEPFKSATQYKVLQLKRSTKYEEAVKILTRNKKFLASVKEAQKELCKII